MFALYIVDQNKSLWFLSVGRQTTRDLSIFDLMVPGLLSLETLQTIFIEIVIKIL